MTDREKVVKGLEVCTQPSSCRKCPYWRVYDSTIEQCAKELMLDALELLKEQEPLEPTRVEIEQAGPLYHRCYCQKCGHYVGNMIKNKVGDVHENFCSSCGQAVKWE